MKSARTFGFYTDCAGYGILENLSDGLFVLNRKLVVRLFNAQAERLLARSRTEVVGRRLGEVFPEARRTLFEEKCLHALRNNAFISFEVHFDGESLAGWYDVRVHPFPGGVIVFFQVATERKRREQILTDSESRYKALARNFPNGRIFLFDAALACLVAEGRELEAIPFQDGSAAGRHLSELLSPLMFAELRHSLLEVFHGAARAAEIRFGERTYETTMAPVRDEDGRVSSGLLVVIDISDRKQLENDLRELASRDGLTGILNHRGFWEAAWREFERRARSGGPISFICIDLDDFKLINDAHGHEAGDAVLRAFAGHLERMVRGADVVGRLGGDEFAVLLPGADLAQAGLVADRLVSGLENMRIAGLRMTASAGVAVSAGALPDARNVFREADQAMYQAKLKGKNRYCLVGSCG